MNHSRSWNRLSLKHFLRELRWVGVEWRQSAVSQNTPKAIYKGSTPSRHSGSSLKDINTVGNETHNNCPRHRLTEVLLHLIQGVEALFLFLNERALIVLNWSIWSMLLIEMNLASRTTVFSQGSFSLKAEGFNVWVLCLLSRLRICIQCTQKSHETKCALRSQFGNVEK